MLATSCAVSSPEANSIGITATTFFAASAASGFSVIIVIANTNMYLNTLYIIKILLTIIKKPLQSYQ